MLITHDEHFVGQLSQKQVAYLRQPATAVQSRRMERTSHRANTHPPARFGEEETCVESCTAANNMLRPEGWDSGLVRDLRASLTNFTIVTDFTIYDFTPYFAYDFYDS